MTIAGSASLGGVLDVAHFETDGYRDHSAARRLQLNGKLLWRVSPSTSVTTILNVFDQPLVQDPLGLTRAQFEQDSRQAPAPAFIFNTRKTVEQQQAGVVIEHKPDRANTINARAYYGTREVWQALGFSGAAPTSAGGIVDLDNRYHGAGLSWTRSARINGTVATVSSCA